MFWNTLCYKNNLFIVGIILFSEYCIFPSFARLYLSCTSNSTNHLMLFFTLAGIRVVT
jgi:hypothetical protein